MNIKLSNILNIALLIAVILLFMLHFGNKDFAKETNKAIENTVVNNSKDTTNSISIAYINLDTILMNYPYYTLLNEEISKKQQDAEGQIQSKTRKLESDYIEIQQKAQKGLMTSKEIAEAEQSLQMRQQEVVNLQQKLSNDLMQEEQRLQMMLADSIKLIVKEYNKTAGYKVIFNNAYGSMIVHADQTMNITQTISKVLNARYKK
jgi:outer membrane protein